MSFADPALTWDVFISYAHVDNAEGWVESFHKQLSVRLDQLGGRSGEIKIWRDRELDEAVIFDAAIKRRLEQSALLLALCSRGYKRSDYCKQEFEGFRQRFGDAGLRVGEYSRIVRVRRHNIPFEELPGTSDRTGAFDFFTAERDDDIGTPLETDSKEFRTKVDRLSRILFRILEDLKGSEPRVVPPPPAGEVFLAETCDGQRSTRDRLANDLAARKVTVTSPTPPPFPAAEHEEAVRSALAECKLAVHMFDECQDRPIQGQPDATYGREQLRLAQERKVPQLIWISRRMPPGQATASSSVDAKWVAFLDELENANRDEGQYRVVRCPRSELASQVEALVLKLRPPARPLGAEPAVLLDAHEKDHLVAFDVCKALLTSGIRPDLIAQGDDPRQSTTLFAERLKQSRGLMILFGRASEEWVRARLGEALKLMVTSSSALRFCGVLLAPPDEGKDQASFEYPLFKTHVLDIRRGLGPDALGPVLQGLAVG